MRYRVDHSKGYFISTRSHVLSSIYGRLHSRCDNVYSEEQKVVWFHLTVLKVTRDFEMSGDL